MLISRRESELGVRSIDISLRVLTFISFVVLLALPEGKMADILPCLCFFAVGVWSVMFPAGPVGWAKMAHKDLYPNDESLWWISRLVGTGLVAFSLFWAVMIVSR